ncbi:MAG TPA: hypothetical protein VF490_05965 [Chryseosolibacter sp.]
MSRKRIASFFAVFFLLVTGCETERLIFKDPYHVRFSEAAHSEKESYSKPVEIEVHYVGPEVKEDLDIHYSVSGSAREGVDYEIAGERGVVTIPKGKFFGTIEIHLINNSNNILRTQDVILTLQTISDPAVEIGQGESAIGKTFTLTIADDCILGGNYLGLRNDVSVPVEDITITSQDCEEYILSNWDIDVFNFPQVRDLTFIDNGDNTLTIPQQEESTLDPSQATIQGTGTVDPVTRQIFMTITLVDFDGQPQVSFKLIPD